MLSNVRAFVPEDRSKSSDSNLTRRQSKDLDATTLACASARPARPPPWQRLQRLGPVLLPCCYPAPLSKGALATIEEFFDKMDADGNGVISRQEAKDFFKTTFGQLSADAMFNEVDEDKNGIITRTEFVGFWQQVKRAGYLEQDILDEIVNLQQGGAWVDWKDSRRS